MRVHVCVRMYVCVYVMVRVCVCVCVLDDEPEAGPQHYILLTGFKQPQLLSALEAVGVHVDNVIKLEWERTHFDSRGSSEGRDIMSGGEK